MFPNFLSRRPGLGWNDSREAHLRKSIRWASRDLRTAPTAKHDVVRKRLQLSAYKIQPVQTLRANGKPNQHTFAQEMLSRLDDDDAVLTHVVFPDEATSRKVNRHNCRIWGSEKPHKVMEHERGTPQLNMRCALATDF
jgi:hypothetical protein